MLDHIVDDSNPCCLNEVNIVTEEECDIPVFTVLLTVLKIDLQGIGSVQVIHLLAVAAHKALHLILLSWKVEIGECLFNIIVIVSRAITHHIGVPEFLKKLYSPEADESNNENQKSN